MAKLKGDLFAQWVLDKTREMSIIFNRIPITSSPKGEYISTGRENTLEGRTLPVFLFWEGK